MDKTLPLAALCALIAASTDASAREVSMTCKGKERSYKMHYDTDARLLKSSNQAFGKDFKVMRVQDDADGVLVHALMAPFGGARDILVRFEAKEKWVKLFYGNGSETTDTCR
jgi:hypothetical protein